MSLMGDITRKVKKKVRFFKINQKLGCYKYIHIMFNDKFNKPFVDFLNKNFDKKEHLILCKRWFSEHPFPEGENVIEIKTFEGLDFHQKNIEKLIFHSLFDEECVDLLYEQKRLLDKSYWVVWGGDLYRAKRDKKHDYVLSNFKGYDTLDERILTERYNLKNHNFFAANYSFPIDVKLLQKISTIKYPNNTVNVLTNNDCTALNLELFDVLSKFIHNDINIHSVVSYGLLEYKQDILDKGYRVFGDKFKWIENYLQPLGYANFLNSIDIFVNSYKQQAAVGNTIALLYLGKKVFIRSDVTTYDYLHKNGIYVYDTKTISDLTYEEFIKNDYAEQNKKNIIKLMSEENLVKCWQELFDDK